MEYVISERAIAIYAGAEEILAGTDLHHHVVDRRHFAARAGITGRAIYLHSLLSGAPASGALRRVTLPRVGNWQAASLAVTDRTAHDYSASVWLESSLIT